MHAKINLNKRQNLTELRVILAIARRWRKLTRQSCSFIPIRRKQSRKIETTVQQRVITKGRNQENMTLNMGV